MMDFKTITAIRVLLYQHFYSDKSNIQLLLNMIVENFDLFAIDYKEDTFTINIKIKKTNMRKSSDYCHTASYYYGIFNNMMTTIFRQKVDYLNQVLYRNGNFTNNELQYMLETSTVNLFYNITTLGDNIVIIHL